MPKIIITNQNLGGIADSQYQGVDNSVAMMVGFDIHSEGGLLKVNQKLTKESGSNIDDLVKKILPCSDGNTYMFGSTNGKIWKRTSGGTYSLEATASPAAGSAGIIDAVEDQGYVYYFMQSRIGRWQIGSAWSTRNDSWATFTTTDADFHPVKKVNLINYIGDGNLVAQIRNGVFTANALDIKDPLRIKSLGALSNELLLGTFINDNVSENEIFRWNTWSTSFSTQDQIPEVGINSFLKTDNFVVVSAGEKGNLYVYSNNVLEQYLQVTGDYSSNKKATVYPNASVNKTGLPLFGLSNKTSNPVLQGVYSIGRTSRNYPLVLNLEHVISTGKLSAVEIGALAMVGDNLLVSWKDSTGTPIYGVDKLDVTAKFDSAYLESRIIKPVRDQANTVGEISVAYKSLPTGTDIDIYVDRNYAGYGTKLTTVNDTKSNCIKTKVEVGDCSTLKVKIAPQVTANLAPEIEQIEINL